MWHGSVQPERTNCALVHVGLPQGAQQVLQSEAGQEEKDEDTVEDAPQHIH